MEKLYVHGFELHFLTTAKLLLCLLAFICAMLTCVHLLRAHIILCAFAAVHHLL